jgi:hypothetical protein
MRIWSPHSGLQIRIMREETRYEARDWAADQLAQRLA